MQTEVEVKFVDIQLTQTRRLLKEVGADCIFPMREMRRVIMDTPDLILHKDHKFLRLRDEGNKITATLKSIDKSRPLNLHSVQEIEVEIDNFDKGIELFTLLGMKVISYQESKRETWSLEGAEVVLDIWPWLNPLIEIEADESAVKKVAKLLGFDWEQALFGGIMPVYRKQYPNIQKNFKITNLKEVWFSDPVPKQLIGESDN